MTMKNDQNHRRSQGGGHRAMAPSKRQKGGGQSIIWPPPKAEFILYIFISSKMKLKIQKSTEMAENRD